MTRAVVGIVLRLSGSLTLAAQSGAEPEAKTSYVTPTFVAATCPIDMQANQGVWDHTIRVREGDNQHPIQAFGQRISLTLKDSRSARIQAATVRVDGLTGKNHVLETVKTLDAKGIKTLRVKFSSQDDGQVSADLWLPGFTSVTSVELLEVSYVDGSIRKISGSNVCRVQPDPLMMISNR